MEGEAMILFLFGLFVGGLVGALAVCLAVAADDRDDFTKGFEAGVHAADLAPLTDNASWIPTAAEVRRSSGL